MYPGALNFLLKIHIFSVARACHRELTRPDSQQWLLGYEFPATLILFEEQKITILASASKGTAPTHLRVYLDN